MTKRLYIGNLPFQTSSTDLSVHIGRHAEVLNCNIITDKFSGRSRGFGFVEVAADTAKNVISALNGSEMDGRKIVVNEAHPREERTSSQAGSHFREASR